MGSKFQLPGVVERCIRTQSKIYAHEGRPDIAEILVNADVRVSEGLTFDNWNGGTYGHGLHLTVPEKLFLRTAKKREQIQDQIRDDLNKVHHVDNEFLSAVFVEMKESDGDWRKDSGLLMKVGKVVPPDAIKRIWDDGCLRLFLSHKSSVKVETAALKERLSVLGVSAFVAHEDISPTEEWQEEIDRALASMDAFVALLTPDYHDSDWTDQEVGYAYAAGVPMISVNLGKNPYGFIGKFQALASSWQRAPLEIAEILIKDEKMVASYIGATRRCASYDNGNYLAALFSSIGALTEAQVDELVEAYNSNSQLQYSYGFSGTRPATFGTGLVGLLNRLSSRTFRYAATSDRKIELDGPPQPPAGSDVPF